MVRLMWLLWSAVCLGDPTFVWIADFVLSVEIQTKAIRRFVITEKAPTRAFSWLKAATTAFTFKTLLRHYAEQALTPP